MSCFVVSVSMRRVLSGVTVYTAGTRNGIHSGPEVLLICGKYRIIVHPIVYLECFKAKRNLIS
jgi:hypothetical protein